MKYIFLYFTLPYCGWSFPSIGSYSTFTVVPHDFECWMIMHRLCDTKYNVDLNISQSPKMIGPVISMVQCIEKYKLRDVLQHHLRQCIFGEISDWKTFTKKIIWENERFKWKASCMLYKELDIYLESIKDIKMSCWWTVARYKPQATKIYRVY